MNKTIKFCIVRLVWIPNFTLTSNVEFWGQICPKKIFSVKNDKSEHHHWMLHIRISLGTKFKLRLTILIFQTKFAQKVYFRSKSAKVNITIEFSIFKLFLVLNFSLNWKFWFFRPYLPKTSISSLKKKKITPTWNLPYWNYPWYQISA